MVGWNLHGDAVGVEPHGHADAGCVGKSRGRVRRGWHHARRGLELTLRRLRVALVRERDLRRHVHALLGEERSGEFVAAEDVVRAREDGDGLAHPDVSEGHALAVGVVAWHAMEERALDDAAVDLSGLADVHGAVLQVVGDEALAHARQTRALGGLEILEVPAPLQLHAVVRQPRGFARGHRRRGVGRGGRAIRAPPRVVLVPRRGRAGRRGRAIGHRLERDAVAELQRLGHPAGPRRALAVAGVDGHVDGPHPLVGVKEAHRRRRRWVSVRGGTSSLASDDTAVNITSQRSGPVQS